MLRFFGLTSSYRAVLFRQIHEIVFFGKGGYDYHTVYNMPIWLRNFTFKNIQEYYEKENEANSKAVASVPKPPSMPPTYTSKIKK